MRGRGAGQAGASDVGWDFSPDPNPGRPRRDSTAASGVGVGDTANAGSGRAQLCILAPWRHLKAVFFSLQTYNVQS